MSWYTQVLVTLDWTFQTHCHPPTTQSVPTSTMKQTWMADLIRRRWTLMEQAINKFLQRLEKQEKKGFKDLAALLSHLPKTAQGSARPGAPCLWQRLWRAVFSQHWTKILYVHPVGVAPVPTRSGPQVTNPGYPGLSQFIW